MPVNVATSRHVGMPKHLSVLYIRRTANTRASAHVSLIRGHKSDVGLMWVDKTVQFLRLTYPGDARRGFFSRRRIAVGRNEIRVTQNPQQICAESWKLFMRTTKRVLRGIDESNKTKGELEETQKDPTIESDREGRVKGVRGWGVIGLVSRRKAGTPREKRVAKRSPPPRLTNLCYSYF